MLAVDVTHRVLRQTAVIDIFQHAYQSSRGNKEDFRDKVQKALIGAVVLTRYGIEIFTLWLNIFWNSINILICLFLFCCLL